MTQSKSIISRYRNLLMGFSILWIAVFHSKIQLPNQILHLIKCLGYGGVDIFLFLSGMGLYFSLNKNSDTLLFYKRRLLRLAPFYLPFLIIWFLYNMSFTDISIAKMIKLFLGNIFMTGWALDLKYQFNWYVQALLWFYLFAPVIYLIVKRASHKPWSYLMIAAVTVAFSLTFVHQETLMAFSRVPIFFIGMIFADWEASGQNKEMFERRLPILLQPLMILGFILIIVSMYRYRGYLMTYGFYWYPFILITPGFCYLLSWIFDFMSKWTVFKPVLFFIKTAGICSFEIYMFHLAFFKLVPKRISISGNRRWLLLLLASIFAGILYHYLIEEAQCFFKKAFKKKGEFLYE